MKTLVTAIILAVLLVGLIPLGISDTDIADADTSVYDIETTITPHEAGNSSASGTITITMYTGDE